MASLSPPSANRPPIAGQPPGNRREFTKPVGDINRNSGNTSSSNFQMRLAKNFFFFLPQNDFSIATVCVFLNVLAANRQNANGKKYTIFESFYQNCPNFKDNFGILPAKHR